jgi:hypothetical protein
LVLDLAQRAQARRRVAAAQRRHGGRLANGRSAAAGHGAAAGAAMAAACPCFGAARRAREAAARRAALSAACGACATRTRCGSTHAACAPVGDAWRGVRAAFRNCAPFRLDDVIAELLTRQNGVTTPHKPASNAGGGRGQRVLRAVL